MIDASRELERPVLRHLDLHAVEEPGRSGIVLIDPLRLVDGYAFVPAELVPIVALFDGVRTVDEIAALATAQCGEAVSVAFVRDLVRDLDEGLLLSSPTFAATLDLAVEQFGRRSQRPARHAGSAGYPEDAAECRAELARIVSERGGGLRPTPRGIVAPHIDLERGRDGYRAVYGDLAGSEPADLYVVFGTGHQGPDAIVTGLAMDWETPLGVVRTDRDFIAAVHAEVGPPDPFDTFLHRDEHSIEFQVLLLAHALGSHAFTVAGFLTGTLVRDGAAFDAERAHATVTALVRAARRSGKRVCWVAGADLAHVGPRFGDIAPIDAARLGTLDRDDRARLEPLAHGRPDRFLTRVFGDGNADRICGATPIYLTATLAGGPAEVLHYGQAVAHDGSQVVTFCGARFDGAG